MQSSWPTSKCLCFGKHSRYLIFWGHLVGKILVSLPVDVQVGPYMCVVPLVWCTKKRLSPSRPLLRRSSNADLCQRGCMFARVLCACTLKPSKCSPLNRDPRTWLKTSHLLCCYLTVAISFTQVLIFSPLSAVSSVFQSWFDISDFSPLVVLLLYTYIFIIYLHSGHSPYSLTWVIMYVSNVW